MKGRYEDMAHHNQLQINTAHAKPPAILVQPSFWDGKSR